MKSVQHEIAKRMRERREAMLPLDIPVKELIEEGREKEDIKEDREDREDREDKQKKRVERLR